MAAIPRRQLGQTDMEVTTLGFGAMELHGGRAPDVSEGQAERLLNAVLDAGINYIDTSIDYGMSEERIGKYISHRRDEYFLASKCGCVVGSATREHVHTAENVRAGVENSLRLLKTDYLDLVQFHRPITEEEFAADGALDEALALKREGKVRYLGVSSTVPNMYQHVEMGVFDAFQVPYSALQRDHEDAIAKASAAGAGIIIRGGVARGAPVDWEKRTYYMVTSESMQDQWERAELDDLLEGSGRAGFLLRFTLSNPDLDTTIVGTSSIDHLADNIATAELGPLPDDVVAEVKRRLEAVAAG